MMEFIDWVGETYGFIMATAVIGLLALTGLILLSVLALLIVVSRGLFLFVPVGIVIFMFFKYHESTKK